MQFTIRQDARAQASTALEKFLRAGRDGMIHPVTGAAFLRAAKTNTLNFEITPDQLIQINSMSDYVATHGSEQGMIDLEFAAQSIMNLRGKKVIWPSQASLKS